MHMKMFNFNLQALLCLDIEPVAFRLTGVQAAVVVVGDGLLLGAGDGVVVLSQRNRQLQRLIRRAAAQAVDPAARAAAGAAQRRRPQQLHLACCLEIHHRKVSCSLCMGNLQALSAETTRPA